MNATKQGEGKKRKSKDPEPLPPALALEMLQSAARECQRAGLFLLFESEPDELRLRVRGATSEATHEGARFVLAGVVKFGDVAKINTAKV